jgi:hypothetical protein
VVSWEMRFGGAARTVALAEVLELEQLSDQVVLKLRDGRAERIPVPPHGIATSSFLSIVRQLRP